MTHVTDRVEWVIIHVTVGVYKVSTSLCLSDWDLVSNGCSVDEVRRGEKVESEDFEGDGPVLLLIPLRT
jgi:hypothetical protein